jgi:hypothetical protein
MRKQKRRPRGTVERIHAGPENPGLDRDLTVYLPPSYARGERHYPVLYMHDGQNLFDPEESFAGSWRVDLAMDHAAARGFEGIAVGIRHAGEEVVRSGKNVGNLEFSSGRNQWNRTDLFRIVRSSRIATQEHQYSGISNGAALRDGPGQKRR